jgi:hypothetical protein
VAEVGLINSVGQGEDVALNLVREYVHCGVQIYEFVLIVLINSKEWQVLRIGLRENYFDQN